ncbi:SpaH/EbpB family LPXTG-anchored major pilin [Enterococcus durans]|uniref:SpaH/EbpB family LPXTG-anchored major pilin n=1 Tax=Enterococcus durans TaxID=53345 RepID=A0A5N0YRH3_9ENTE|nr:SpaH/EbpB family LPXTG-anchored major pilin [Enterococcus durans]KAA9178715.1 SpaH/EbpB family LPXTG-anchored major pilin [Enterococcus durans]KAA9185858.1 SpaH/EbpB family LPXTG-anchored major pilin [Enterococcus durans]KAA9186332.1 SpaH/EbpB family LPXTG-anchored major pilin [Enterococcus durans]KAA9191060.1 SpaH/EbpB family LPXTG-anchored major pilin [Enterococcus durans]KAA9193275.1 SpaH/EbpB family LPXTG-anchored major pilin [Enterococcus durans]
MNKLNLIKGFSILLLATVGFGNSQDTKAEEVSEKPSAITITLHKKGFESLPTDQANSGLVSKEFGEENIAGVDFEQFDVTAVYYGLLNDNPDTQDDDDGMTAAAAIAWMQGKDYEDWNTILNGADPVDSHTTDDEGKAVFTNVQVSEGDGRDKVYLFLETYSPAHISKVATPMVVMIPVMMPNVVDGTWDGSSWKDTFNKDVHLYPKNEVREAEKKMNVPDDDELKEVILDKGAEGTETISYLDLEKGKQVSYTITAPIPYFIDSVNTVNEVSYAVIKNFVITDTPTTGLSYFDQEIEVKVGNEILIKGTDYSVAQSGNGFAVTILTEKEDGTANEGTLAKLAKGRGGDLMITYNMLVTATIKADEFHNNTATILIGRNDAYDYNEEVIPDEKVATGGRKFEKYDASSKQMLSGAQFEIWNGNKDKFAVFYKDGAALTTYEAGADRTVWADSGSGVAATKFTSNDQGKFEVQGLDYDTYHAKEVVAPSGYALPTGDKAYTTFTVFFGSYDESVSVLGQENPGEESIPNIKKGYLPSTGGNGILAFLLVGLSLMIGTYTWYRKSKATE